MNESKNFYRKFIKENSEVIDRIERLSEIIFGVIMTLTFTGTISVAEGGIQEVKLTLWAALGCNTAWGIIDGMFLIMNRLYDRGRGFEIFRTVRNAKTDAEANNVIMDNLNPVIAEVIGDSQVDELRKELNKLPDPPKRAFLTSKDFVNAFYVFLLVFLSTFPMALPLLFIKDPFIALRSSNAVGLVIMFIAGFLIGKKAGFNSWLIGLLFAVIGGVLVFMTIALGG